MTRKSATPSIREAIGIFFDAKHLEAAITDLKSKGFRDEDLGLLAGENTVREKLGHLYTDINKDQASPDAPNTAFVARDSIGDTAHALFGTLYIVGSALAGGAVVATAGILGGALAVAAATTAVFGGIGVVLGAIINKSDAEYLEEQVDEGHLLLFVRTRDGDHEKLAVQTLAAHAAFDPRIHTVPG